jgi:hypothetical protein
MARERIVRRNDPMIFTLARGRCGDRFAIYRPGRFRNACWLDVSTQ